jgi:two-component system, sensor histidine kinase and response regulator
MVEHPQRRVLVVEDNEVNQAVAVAILARLGYRPDLAGDGQQAVELVVQGHYGLVLMDCQLPLLDGYQATADIRRREGTTRHTPIVAMTAEVLEDRQRCLAAGMDDHIAKPVLLAELQVVLSRWLEGEATTAQAGGPAAAIGPTWEVLDPNRLAELGMLEATHNGTVLIDSLVEHLLARIPIDLADLRSALDQGDATGVTRITHRLKGAAATVGSSGMVNLCEHLEVLARAGAIPPADNLVSRLEQEFNRVIRALEAVVPGRRSPGRPTW